MHNTLKFLSHLISPGERHPDSEEVQAVCYSPSLKSTKALWAFLDLIGYYGSYIPILRLPST